MSKRSFYKLIPWLLVLFVALYPQLGSFQNSSNGSSFVQILRNFFNLATGGLLFYEEDMFTVITDELDDMTPEDQAIYDFVVVGAGTAGSAIASRLSEDKNVTVLLIEAGVPENALMDVPLLAMYLQATEAINWNYKMERSPNYCRAFLNGRCNMPRGKVMGGSSVINFMLATRGNYRDYDNWAFNMGCEGWSWQDVHPIFRRMESFDLPRDYPNIAWEYHSTGGPVHISRANYRTKSAEAFLEAGVERGFDVIDYEGPEMIGYSYMHTTQKNGSRCSSNRAYLYPAKRRSNLFLTRKSHADKILIDPESRRVYGVSFTKKNQEIRVFAKKEVIVCAGSIGSPKLLMLSGIGPRHHLNELNIPIIRDALVGYNLMDHMSYWGLNFLVNESVALLTEELFLPQNPSIPDYFAYRKGPLTIPGSVEAASFIIAGNLSARQGVPDMELLFSSISVGGDPLAHEAISLIGEHYDSYLSNMRGKQSYIIIPTLLTPKSRGRVMLRSTNPQDKPLLYPNYFDHPDDMKRMILGIRESIKLSQTRAMQRYDSKLPDNPILGCEGFEKDSDEFWDCAVRTFADTLYHPAGTCKMGARTDPTAIVDPRLKVIGVKGLRVADASIMPMIIAGHTMLPTMMIGEKLAMMVKEDWKLV